MQHPFGPHHFANWTLSLHAFHTRSSGAVKTRLISNDEFVDFLWLASILFPFLRDWLF
jgi:hypothetical protein